MHTALLCLCFVMVISWWRHQMQIFSVLLVVCAGNSPVTVNSPHKGQWHGASMFSLICHWTDGWVNNRGAGDLRRHSAHYGVSWTMVYFYPYIYLCCFTGTGAIVEGLGIFRPKIMTTRNITTHSGQDKCISLEKGDVVLSNFHWDLFRNIQLMICHHWFR